LTERHEFQCPYTKSLTGIEREGGREREKRERERERERFDFEVGTYYNFIDIH
jgi:hypothetical protein